MNGGQGEDKRRRNTWPTKPCSALLFLLLNLVPLLVLSADTFCRSEFPSPPDFVFGLGTFAYQMDEDLSTQRA
ncbi:hypothetical protein RHMOL_Rhmol13G0043100 [Rhododendron molle]|uniref:Uncharacterized protein n=1 Tax=Rhododendron molle TaxID=49168 RepID=A0ACC0L3F1_RHOML|nr:hypothetical protein RHMOL_Rhmol13G0043100 [Rhododendron molle]